MPNAVTNAVVVPVDLQVNGEKALQSVETFKKDAQEKLSSLDVFQNEMNGSMPIMEMMKSLSVMGDPFDGFADSAKAASAAVQTMRNAISGLISAIDAGSISNGMTRMFESSYRTIMSSIESYNKQIARGLQTEVGSKAFEDAKSTIKLSTATGLSAARDMTQLLKFAQSRETGLSSDQLGQLMPALYSVVRSEADEYIRKTKSTPRVDELAKYISQQKVFRDSAVNGSAGASFTNAQLEALARGAILATRSRATRDNADIYEAAGLKRSEHQFVVDQMPAVFAKAYKNYGKPYEEKLGNNVSYSYGRQAADAKVYADYRRLVRNGNQQAIQLGLDVGLLRAQNGRYRFSGNANLAQMDTMAGLVAQAVGEAKSSLPYHFVDRNNPTQQEKLLGRQNKVFQDSLELMEVLAGQQGLDPNVYGYVPYGTDRKSIAASSKLFNFVSSNRYNKHSPKIATLGGKDQYVVPKTVLDANGNLVWRDPSWIKENGVQEKNDDYFATISNSAFTQMLGMHGNNTYGYGRDDNARSIYDTPKAIRLNTSHLYKQITDKNGTRMIVDPDKQKEADRINRIFARQETLMYGKPGTRPEDQTEYISAYGDAGSITLIPKTEYNSIVGKFAAKGMANPFDNMNTGGLFVSGDYQNAMKQIDLSRKKATPGNPYSLFGYSRQPNAALVDFEKIYDYLGIDKADSFLRKNERIDGVALFDPSVLGVNAQMRSSFVDKFMGQSMNWRKLLTDSGLLENAYASGQNRGLIAINADNALKKGETGYSFFMPQIGLKSVDLYGNGKKYSVNEMIQEMNRLAVSTDTKDIEKLNEIRSKYFFDIMSKKYDALLPESTVKNNDKFRIISKNAFTNPEGLFKGEQWARDRGDGTVELTAAQQQKYYQTALEMTGGYWINNTGLDFRTDKDFIPESLAAAMGANTGELKERSNANYAEYLARLRKDENARAEFLKSSAYGRRLLNEGNANSRAADILIQSHINDIESKQAQGTLYLPEYGVDNLLTGVLPGSIFGNIFEKAFGVRVNDDNAYRKLFHYGTNQDSDFFQALTDQQKGAIRSNAQLARVMLSRMPAGAGEYSIKTQGLNDEQAIRKALDAIGADYSDSILTDPGLQFRLMTGDYDGDTAWIVRGLSDNVFERAGVIQQYVDKARSDIQKKLKVTNDSETRRQLEDNLKAFTEFGANHGTAQLGMGLATAAQRNALVLDDNDPQKWIAVAQAIDAYDRQTSQAMKEGEVVELGSLASKQAMEGGLYRRFIKQINAYAQGSENANPALFSVRLPEIRDVATLSDVAFNFSQKAKGEDVGATFARGLDDWLYEQYGDSDSYEAQAARLYGGMFKNVATGTKLVDRNDIFNGRLLAVKWGQDLERRRAAGWDVASISEEESKLNSFVRRLSQQENSGSLVEDYQKRISAFQQKREDLLNAGVAVDDQQIKEIDTTISLFEGLTRTPTQAAEAVAAARADKLKEQTEEVQKRIQENLERLKSSGANLSTTEEALLAPALSTDLLQVSGADWSSTTPWTYQEMQRRNKDFALRGVDVRRLPTARNGQTKIQKENPIDATFLPYPHNTAGILADKATILAREMDQAHEVTSLFTDNTVSLMGSYRHKAFENALTAIAKGQSDVDIGSIYEAVLTSEARTTDGRFNALGLELERDASTGKYTIKNAKSEISEDVNNALGVYNSKTGKYEGGTLASFINSVVAGRRVVNIEGANLDQNGNKINIDELNKHGSNPQTSIDINGNGQTINKKLRFSPDAILQDKNGQYTMIDYKSGSQGAQDALFQMLVYAKHIQNKAMGPDADKNGWSQYIDKQTGKLNFNALAAYDTSSGELYSYKFNEDDMNEMFSIYQAAIENKHFNNEEDRINAERKLRAEFAKKYGLKATKTETKPVDVVGRTYADESKGSWYGDFVANKLVKDEETLSDIQSNSYKAIRQYGNIAEGGYSPFAAMRRQLNETLNDETINDMLQKAAAQKDLGAVDALLKMQTTKRDAREQLNRAELLAAQNAYDDVDAFMLQQIYGVNKPSSVQIYDAVNKRLLNAASVREGLLTNEEYRKDGKWINDEAEKIYNESLKAEERVTENFNNLLPMLSEKEIKQSNKKLQSLIADNKEDTIEETIDEYYNNRYDAIEQYVKQQQANMAEYQKKLDQKDANGNYALEKGSTARAVFDELLYTAQANMETAAEFLGDKSNIREMARRDYERSIGLSNGGKVKTRAQRQQEYLQLIEREYNEATDLASTRKIGALKAARTRAQKRGDTDRAQELTDEINERLKNAETARSKMQEYDRMNERYQETRKLEDLNKQSTLDSINSMYTGVGLTRDQVVAARYSSRLQQIQKYKDTLSEEELREFNKTHSNDELRKQIEREVQEEGLSNGIKTEQRAASLFTQATGGQLSNEARATMKSDEIKKAVEDEKKRISELLQDVSIVGEERKRLERASETLERIDTNGIYSRILNDLNSGDELAALSRQNKTNAVNRSTAEQERALQYSQQDYRRSRLQSLATLGVFRNYYANQNRAIQLSRDNERRQSRIAELNDANKIIDQKLKTATGDQKLDLETERKNNLSQIASYNSQIAEAANEIENLTGVSGALESVMLSAGQAVGQLAQRLGRQLFQRAAQETKRFVQEFDASMATIQMITLKSDSEMSSLGSGLIDRAKELKVSVSEITTSAESLYRQGLSDEEVNERLGVISKFSKVSGTKIDAATKLITVAMNTGLVENPQTAADVVTALGDSAATNAAEIEKGIEKAGAAAAVDGTTFGQLAAMLTAITSTTQIGGNVAGTTLNTLFARMNKIGTNELIYDENGNAVSGSAVAQLLEEQGVKTYVNGKKRSSFDVLYDLSQKWEGMSDANQQQIATAVAGTRRYSNFAAIMQGMAEGDIARYLDLIDESAGITDKKYEVYTETLAASLTNLQTTFDGLVNDVVSSGFVGNVVDGLATIVQGIDNVTESAGGLAGVIPTLLMIATIMGGLRSGTLAGIGIAAGTALIGGTVLGVIGAQQTPEQRYKQQYEEYKKQDSAVFSGIDTLKTLREKSNRTEEEEKQYVSLINQYATRFGMIDSSAAGAVGSIEGLSAAIASLGGNADEAADAVIKEADKRRNDNWARSIYQARPAIVESIVGDINASEVASNKSGQLGSHLFDGIFEYDDASKRYRISNNAIENLRNSTDVNIVDALYSMTESAVVGNREEVENALPQNLLDHLTTWYSDTDKDFASGLTELLLDSKEQGLEEVLSVILNSISAGISEDITKSNDYDSATKAFRSHLSDYLKEQYSSAEIDEITKTATDSYFEALKTMNQNEAVKEALSFIPSTADYNTLTRNISSMLSGTEEPGRITLSILSQLTDNSFFKNNETGEIVSSDIIKKDIKSRAVDLMQAFMAGEAETDVVTGFVDYYNMINDINNTKKALAAEGEIPDLLPLPSFDEYKAGNKVIKSREELEKLYDNGEVGSKTVAAQIEQMAQDVVNGYTIQKSPIFDAISTVANSTATSAWEKKYGVSASADSIVSLLLGGGFETVNDFNNFLAQNSIAAQDFNILYGQSAELQNVLRQVRKNPETGLIEAPENILDQILLAARSASGTYGAAQLTAQEKAAYALSGFSGLTEGNLFVSQSERERAQQEAYAKYSARYDETIENINNSFKDDEEARKQRLESIPDKFTQEEFLASSAWKQFSNEDLNRMALDQYQSQYLQEILGASLYDRLLKGASGGKGLTTEESDYARMLLNNASLGLTSLTARQQLSGIQQVRAALSGAGVGTGEGQFSKEVADAYMAQFSGWDRLYALSSKESLTEQEAQDLATLQLQFEEFQKNAQIQVDVEGVQALEEAGKVAAGTAAELEKLRKGGKVAIDVIMQIDTSAFESGQLLARLFNGSQQEQYEAAMQLSGMSRDQFFAGGRQDENLARVQQNQRVIAETEGAETWLQLYSKTSGAQREAILAAARAAGYELVGPQSEDEYIDNINNRPWKNERTRFDYVGTDRQYTSAYAGTERNYSELELAIARSRILSGEFNPEDNYSLYSAAEKSFGSYGQEYLRLGASADKRDRELAEFEQTQAIRESASSYREQALANERARLAYSNLSDEDNRSTLMSYLGLTQDQYNTYASENGGERIREMVNERRTNLMNQLVEEFENILPEGLMNGIDVSSYTDFDSLVNDVVEAAGDAGDAVKAQLEKFRDAFNGVTNVGTMDATLAYSETQGILNKGLYERNGLKTISDNIDTILANREGNEALATTIGRLGESIGWKQEWNKAAFGNQLGNAALTLLGNGALTSQQYMAMMAPYITGQTKDTGFYATLGQSLFGSNVNSQGTFNLPKTKEEVNDLATIVTNIQSDANLGALFDEWTSSIDGFGDAIKALADGDVNKAQKVLKDLNDQMADKRANEAAKYAKNVGNLGNAVAGLMKGGTDATKARQEIDKMFSDLQDQKKALNKAKGKSGAQLKEAKDKEDDPTLDILDDLLPFDANDIANMSAEKISQLVDELGPVLNEQLQSMFDVMLGSLDIDPHMDLSGIKVNTDGSVDLSAVEGMIGETAARILQACLELAGKYAEVDLSAILNGDTVEVQAIVNALKSAGVKSGGGGYNRGGGKSGGGGGGGGGGKSESQKLLQSQKERIASIQHQNTMLELQADDAARENNDYEYQNLINEQIDGQTRLRDAYQQNIMELRNMLSTLEAESDDWYSVQEAIRSAEEEVAKYNANVDALESKMLQETRERYDFDSSLRTHDESMLENENSRNRRLNDYSNWRENLAQRAANYQTQIALDRGYAGAVRTRLEEQIMNGDGDSDYARELREELNQIIESSANLYEEIENLSNEVVELNSTMKDNAMQTPQFWSSVYGSQGEAARRNRQWGQALAITEQQKENNQTQRSILQEDIERVVADLDQAVIGSQQWHELLQLIYTDEEDLLQLTLDDMDLEIQRMQDIQSAFDETFSHMQHLENNEMGQFEINKFNGNYSGMFTNLNNYVVALQARDEAMGAYINQLNNELNNATTAEAQEEIRKLIEQAEEERLQIAQDMNAVWERRLSTLTQKQEYELAPLQHEQTMLGYQEQYFGRLNDYEAYNDVLDKQDQIRLDSIATLEDHRKELEAELSLVDETTEAYKNYQNQINEVTKRIAEETKGLDENNKKRLDALKIQQQNEDRGQNHALDMYSLMADRAQTLGNTDQLVDVLGLRIEELRAAISQNDQQASEYETLMNDLVKGDTKWLEARDQIWNIKKDTAQKENEILKLEQQIDMQRLSEIQKQHSRNNAYNEHELRMLDTEASANQTLGNFEEYRDVLGQQISAYDRIHDALVQARDATLKQMATLEKGTEAWYNARDAVWSYDEAIANANNTMLERQLAIESSQIQQMTTEFNDSQLQNNTMLQIVRARKQGYNDANDFENFQKESAKEKEILDQQIEDRKAYVENMKNQLSETTKGTTAWYNLRASIAQEIANIENMESQSDQLGRQQEQSRIDHMLERMDYEDSNRQHNLSLIQYEQTKYQNAGQLSNYGIMLEKENELRAQSIKANQADLEMLRAEQAELDKGSKEYNRLTDAIKKKEEAIAADTVEIDKNTKALKDNNNEIRKTRTELENVVKKELETREQERRDRLSAEVSLQKTILDTIRQSYRASWDLQKEDLEKKQDALRKEKDLINERLDARKQAMEEEERYSELEELQRQLALISNDPTRTRDAKELRAQISEIEKDISWDRAYEEAENATRQIDDEIQAITDYTTVHGENLEEMLKDANNFADEIATIMSGGWESVSGFLKANNEEFKNSTAAAQEEMLTGWEDTWKKMNGIIDTYWEQIAGILSSYENFVAFMKDSTEYISSSEAGQKILEYGWEVLYENWVSSGFISPEAENYSGDEHPWFDVNSETGLVDMLGDNFAWLNYGKDKPELEDQEISDYSDIGEEAKEPDVTPITAKDLFDSLGITAAEERAKLSYGITHAEPVKTDETTLVVDEQIPSFLDSYDQMISDYTDRGIREAENRRWYETDDYFVLPTGTKKKDDSKSSSSSSSSTPGTGDKSGSGSSDSAADVRAAKDKKIKASLNGSDSLQYAAKAYDTDSDGHAYSPYGSNLESAHNSNKELGFSVNEIKQTQEEIDKLNKIFNKRRNAEGGLVDYTGPTWVDGTPTKPEAFLDSTDTALLRKLTDTLNYISLSPGIWPNADAFSGGNTSYGNISIVINQAELKSDADFEDVAHKIGRAFTKEMSKKGYNLTGYNL